MCNTQPTKFGLTHVLINLPTPSPELCVTVLFFSEFGFNLATVVVTIYP